VLGGDDGVGIALVCAYCSAASVQDEHFLGAERCYCKVGPNISFGHDAVLACYSPPLLNSPGSHCCALVARRLISSLGAGAVTPTSKALSDAC
jgi:hypothetical protein